MFFTDSCIAWYVHIYRGGNRKQLKEKEKKQMINVVC